MDLWVVVGVKVEPGHIAESEADMAGGFGMVKRVTKGLVMGKS